MLFSLIFCSNLHMLDTTLMTVNYLSLCLFRLSAATKCVFVHWVNILWNNSQHWPIVRDVIRGTTSTMHLHYSHCTGHLQAASGGDGDVIDEGYLAEVRSKVAYLHSCFYCIYQPLRPLCCVQQVLIFFIGNCSHSHTLISQ